MNGILEGQNSAKLSVIGVRVVRTESWGMLTAESLK